MGIPSTKREWYRFLNGYSNFAALATGVAISESNANAAAAVRSVLTLTNVPVTLADNAGVVAYGSVKLLDFPDGLIVIHAAIADLRITKSSAGVNTDWDGDFGLGSVAANNGATLATTEQNVIPTTATPQAAAGATTAKGLSTAAVVLDGTATAVDLYFNALVDDADHDVTTTPANLILNGTITLIWSFVGDYSA